MYIGRRFPIRLAAVIGIMCFLASCSSPSEEIIEETTEEPTTAENVEENMETSVSEIILSYGCNAKNDVVYRLEWGPVPNAEQCELLCRVDDEEEWTLLTLDPADGSSGVYKDKKARNYEKVEYVLRYTLGGKTYESNHVEINIPTTPYGMKISNMTDEGIEYYWKKPEGVTGYEIFRSYEVDGKWKLLGEKKYNEDTFLDSNFSRKKDSVYYKIRSFVEIDGVRTYGKFSDITKAKRRKKFKLELDTVYLRTDESRKIMSYIGWGEGYDLVWRSSDESCVKVDENGVITGISAGECVISCRSNSFEGEDTCTVIVDRTADTMLANYASDYIQKTEENITVWTKQDSASEGSGPVTVMITGDMMCTGAQQGKQGYDTGDYNFNGSYKYVKDIISDADLAIGNLETVLSPSWPYMHENAYIDNKANCNAPPRYLDALKYAGFDAVVMSNNHNCDSGVRGLVETIEQVERYELARTGAFKDSDEQRGLLMDVKGIRLGFLSYTSPITGFNKKDGDWSKDDVNEKLNYYDKKKAERDVEFLRAQGAEFVIVYMHWGVKNYFLTTNAQLREAKEIAAMDVDYIVGAHAHLLQPYEVIETDDGKRVPCFFSLGDFQASVDQIEGNRDSVILKLALERDDKGNVKLVGESCIPCYTLTEYDNDYYVTVPLLEENRKIFPDYDEIRARIQEAIGTKLVLD